MIGFIHIDPIHGKIELPEYVQNIIHTEEFERLRGLKMNGLAYYMFPGSNHTRYEHCIGYAYFLNFVTKLIINLTLALCNNNNNYLCIIYL